MKLQIIICQQLLILEFFVSLVNTESYHELLYLESKVFQIIHLYLGQVTSKSSTEKNGRKEI